MFTLLKPSNFKYCQQHFCKFSVVTNNYITSYNNVRKNENLTDLLSGLSNNKNISTKYLRFPFNQSTRGVHSSGTFLQKYEISEVLKKGMSVFKDVDFKNLSNAPSSTLVYGLGGLIPFVAAPVSFLFIGYSANIAFAQLAYGATILAFVGGVKWGYAVGNNKPTFKDIGLSTIPSLVACVGLLVPQSLGLLVISTGLGAAVYVDMLTSHYPSWFRALRCLLTSTAVISLLTTLLCSF